MADIDIDKILEKNEKQENKKKSFKTAQLIIGITAGICILAAAAVFTLFFITGEKSASYMPLNPGPKYLYNRVGGSTEKWQVLDKKVNIDGIDCSVLNKIDQSNYYSSQEYLYMSEQGLVQLATSVNFGEKEKNPILLLPAKIKTGKTFIAGILSGREIKGTIAGNEEVSGAMGVIKAYKIELKADKTYDRTMWYAKDIGVIKMSDNARKAEIVLIMVEK